MKVIALLSVILSATSFGQNAVVNERIDGCVLVRHSHEGSDFHSPNGYIRVFNEEDMNIQIEEGFDIFCPSFATTLSKPPVTDPAPLPKPTEPLPTPEEK